MHIQWKYLDLSIQRNIKLLDVKFGVPCSTHWVLRILLNSPVTVTSQLSPLFVKKSTFISRYIVHPGGGGAAKLVCESCGAEYPYVASPSPCAFCAVMKESGVVVKFGRYERQWLWSDWGWAVMHNGSYVGQPIPGLIPSSRVEKFTAKHKAMAAAKILEEREWLHIHYSGPGRPDYTISVEPYPLKPVQPLPGHRAIGVNVESRQ